MKLPINYNNSVGVVGFVKISECDDEDKYASHYDRVNSFLRL